MQKIIDKIIITIENGDEDTARVIVTTEPVFDAETEVAEITPNVALATTIMNFIRDNNEKEIVH